MSQEMNRILAGLTGEVEVTRKKEAQPAQSFQEMESQLGDAAHSGVRLIQLQREADANRSIYETFLARYKQAMAQESLAVPDARLISLAVPPEDPVYPNMLRFLLVGSFGGLAIGGAFAFLREGFDRRIRQAGDIETVTGVPVFGFLPKVSRWRGLPPQDYPVNDPHSRFGTALMRIHTALRAPQSLDRKQVILVTSAQPGDGKTTFCTGLARSLAKSGMRVLVIDADPYRSQVATAFGASPIPAVDRSIEQRGRLHRPPQGGRTEEHARWQKHDLSAKRYAHWRANGIHLEARLEEQARCILVIIGATPKGRKELVGFTDGIHLETRIEEQAQCILVIIAATPEGIADRRWAVFCATCGVTLYCRRSLTNPATS
jgi:hypothetical protein